MIDRLLNMLDAFEFCRARRIMRRSARAGMGVKW